MSEQHPPETPRDLELGPGLGRRRAELFSRSPDPGPELPDSGRGTALLLLRALTGPGLWLFLAAWWMAGAVLGETWLGAPLAVVLAEHGGLIVVGLLGALVGNATAIGGGIVFLPFMMVFYDLAPIESLQVAIVTQAFGMTSGSVAWARAEKPPQGGRGALALGLLLGFALSVGVLAPSTALVREVFGPVSILVGLSVLMVLRVRATETDLPRQAWPGLLVASTLGAVVTGWVAIGIGEVVAAWLLLRWRLRAAQAIFAGVVLLAADSILLAMAHVFLVGGVRWELIFPLVTGAVVGARLGPVVARAVAPAVLKVGFASVAILQGLLYLVL